MAEKQMPRQDIGYYVCHQGSKFLLDTLVRKMRLEPTTILCNLEQLGNTVSLSIPIVLVQVMDGDRLAGRNVLSCEFGVGLSWARNILSILSASDGTLRGPVYPG